MANVTPPPVPTQVALADSDGRATRPWIAWFTTLGQIFGFNQTIQSNGTAVPQETVLNFVGFTVKDNPSNGSTDISIPQSGPTFQSGSVDVPVSGGDYSTVDVTFPTALSAIPKVFVNAKEYPRGTNTPMTCQAVAITEKGFTISVACAVPTGGGGATVDIAISVDWVSIG